MKIYKLYIKNSLPFLTILFLLSVNMKSVYAQDESLKDREDYAKVATRHFNNGNWEEGKKVTDLGIEKYPRDSDLRMLLGKYYFEKKNYDLARYELIEALKYNDINAGAKQILVNVEIESGRYSSAICYINELLELNPYSKDLWLKQIHVYRLQGNHTEANRMLKRLSHIYPDDKQIKESYLYNVEEEIAKEYRSGKIENAIELATVLVQENPLNERFYLEIINTYLKAGDHNRALIYADRGLFYIPHSTQLINKKADILGELHRYDEALSFLQAKTKEGTYKGDDQNRYNYLMETAASHYKKTDPYHLYMTLYEKNPRNNEAFNYVLNTSIANGLYDDALDILKRAKTARGESKELMSKERLVYERMGAQSKADQLTTLLYDRYPDDADLKYDYTQYRVKQAKAYMLEGIYNKAIEHWSFVIENGDEEQQENALLSVYNCYYQLEKFDEALLTLDQLKNKYPETPEWSAKKAVIYGKQKKYQQALSEYENAILLSTASDLDRALIGYDELATIYTKQLIEDYEFLQASPIIERWLELYPASEVGVLYGINISAQMKNYDSMIKYASLGQVNHPDNMFFKIKHAEALNLKKEHRESLDILVPALNVNPYHKELIGAYSQTTEDYVAVLLKESKNEESISLIDSALVYDENNKSLKYYKGVAFEKINENDSAYYYQSFYEPSLLELSDFKKHLRFLKHKTYKNQISISYLRARYGDDYTISTISSIEYSRFAKRDTYTGRLSYAGRDEGKGVQGQLEWNRDWKPSLRTRIDGAYSNDIFAKFIISGSIYKTFKKGWEAEVGAGYRRSADNDNIYNIVGGIAKDWESWWVNAKINGFLMKSKGYYSLLAQARFHLNNPRNFLSIMGSIGSAPEIEIVDTQLFKGFEATNTMVGAGAHHMLSDKFTLALIGNWYNFEDTREINKGKKRNLYNLFIQLHVRF